MKNIIIRKAKAEEASMISALAIRSKAYWGYDLEFMNACVEELSHTSIQLTDDEFFYAVAEFESNIAGFYKLENLNAPKVLLEALFVDPKVMGHGIGKHLLEHALQQVKKRRGNELTLQSDPYAESFYSKMGAKKIGRLESGSIKGRFLPLMSFTIT